MWMAVSMPASPKPIMITYMPILKEGGRKEGITRKDEKRAKER
jgi:hypothetical protein